MSDSRLRIHRRALKKFVREFDVDLVVLFGSHATGKNHARSDVDLAIRTRISPGKRDLEWHMRFWLAADDIVPREDVQAVLLNDADPLLLAEVARDGIPLYSADRHTFLEFQSYASRRFADNAKFFHLESEYLRLGAAGAKV